MNTPLVTVIMPAYNSGRYIVEAIRSVMEQTWECWELLVLDDGSRDDTCALVQALAEEDSRIRLLPNGENMGAAKTRNRGLDLAQGEFVAFLDSDDRWHPQKLERQMDRLAETSAALCYCSYAIVDEAGETTHKPYTVPEQITFRQLLKENVIGCSTVVLRRDALGANRFPTDFYHEDFVLWLRLLQQGHRAVGCSEILADWRYRQDSRSFDKFHSAQNRWRIYRRYLKLPLFRSVGCFAAYAMAGLRKYLPFSR